MEDALKVCGGFEYNLPYLIKRDKKVEDSGIYGSKKDLQMKTNGSKYIICQTDRIRYVLRLIIIT